MAQRIEPTRVRERGTVVTRSSGPEQKIAAVRRIVAECQYAKVDGIMVDLFTAQAILAVHDALRPDLRATFSSWPIAKMGIVAFRLLAKNSGAA